MTASPIICKDCQREIQAGTGPAVTGLCPDCYEAAGEDSRERAEAAVVTTPRPHDESWFTPFTVACFVLAVPLSVWDWLKRKVAR